MSLCKRKGNFGEDEYHRCFILGCDGYVHPKTAETCPVCNFKKCENGHCACDASEETRYALAVLYETYCEFCSEVDSEPEIDNDLMEQIEEGQRDGTEVWISSFTTIDRGEH